MFKIIRVWHFKKPNELSSTLKTLVKKKKIKNSIKFKIQYNGYHIHFTINSLVDLCLKGN